MIIVYQTVLQQRPQKMLHQLMSPPPLVSYANLLCLVKMSFKHALILLLGEFDILLMLCDH